MTPAGGGMRAGGGEWRLGAWYFSYFAAAGVFLPYFSAYLLDRGLEARAVGVLFAALTVTKLFTPWVWGYVADRTGLRRRVVCAASAGALAAFAAVAWAPGFPTLFAALLVFGFFWQGVLPQFEALTLNRLGERASRYVHVRLWGSVGYVAAVLGVGALLERLPVSGVLFFVLAGLVLVVGAALALPADPVSGRPADAEPPAPRGRSSVPVWLAAFFLASLAMQASHGAFYAFFTPFLLDHGYRPGAIGALWALGVVCEIVLFAFAHRWIERYPAERLLLACFAAAVVRWGLTAALADQPVWLAASQVLTRRPSASITPSPCTSSGACSGTGGSGAPRRCTRASRSARGARWAASRPASSSLPSAARPPSSGRRPSPRSAPCSSAPSSGRGSRTWAGGLYPSRHRDDNPRPSFGANEDHPWNRYASGCSGSARSGRAPSTCSAATRARSRAGPDAASR